MEIPVDKYDLAVGFFVLIGLIALVGLTVYLAGPDFFDFDSVKVKTYLPSTYGLRRGVPVTFLEIEVGHVIAVDLSDRPYPAERIEVVFTIGREYKDLITRDFHTSLEQTDVVGFLSGGEIILNPPEGDETLPAGEPVQDGDVLPYVKTPAMFDGLVDLPKRLENEVLPKVDSLLSELNLFLRRLNDPEGDVLATASAMREMAERLSDPAGEMARMLEKTDRLVAEITDDQNLVFSLLTNRKLAAELEEIVQNVHAASKQGVSVTGESGRIIDELKGLLVESRTFLGDTQPLIRQIMENVLFLQASLIPLLEDAGTITSLAAEAAGNLPDMAAGARTQLRELEDITGAVKKLPILRWYVEDKSLEDPTLLKPLLYQRFKKRPAPSVGPEEENSE